MGRPNPIVIINDGGQTNDCNTSTSVENSGYYDGRTGFWARGSVPKKAQRRVTIKSLIWEDKIFFQAELNGVFVVRRGSDRMINGTKLLEASTIAAERRNSILGMEKRKEVINDGPNFAQGVWIPLERAAELAGKEKIAENLYPLLAHDVHPFVRSEMQQSPPSVGEIAPVSHFRSSSINSRTSFTVRLPVRRKKFSFAAIHQTIDAKQNDSKIQKMEKTADRVQESSEEQPEDPKQQKKQALDRLMVEFYKFFEGRIPVTSCARYKASSSSRASNSASSTAPGEKTSNEKHSKRKLGDQNDGQRDGGEDDDSHKRGKPSNDPPISSTTGSTNRLACPYFKRNPRKYRLVHVCASRGWDSIPRLKEHLYRRHVLPPQCPRCCQTFKSKPQLKEHQRDPTGCDVQKMDIQQQRSEGFDEEQKEKLKCRKASFQADNEEEKWRGVYMILFPDIPPSAIPSPYYYDDDLSDRQSDDSAENTGLARFEELLTRELPQSVRKELKIAMEKECGNPEDKLKCVEENLPNIVRNCLEQLFRTHEESRRPAPSVSSNEPSTSATNSDENPVVLRPDMYAAGPSDREYHKVSGELSDDYPGCKLPAETSPDTWEKFDFSNIVGGELANSAGGTLHTSNVGVFGPNYLDHFPFDDAYWVSRLGMTEDNFVQLGAVDETPPGLSRKGKGRADVTVNDGSQELAQYQG